MNPNENDSKTVRNTHLYHAHVYFTLAEDAIAKRFAERAQKESLFSFIEKVDRSVGPHPTPMIELHFKQDQYASVRDWIAAERGPLSVLFHQDTGDDVKDHSENIEWLGESLKLDFGFFELIKKHPELKIHP